MEPGTILADRYEIVSVIAEGASSTVWEARDRRGGEIVAVKAVSMERAGWRSEVRDRFEKEARILQMVQHRHLVGVRDRGETDDGLLYLVLDRLTGDTLADRIARPPRLGWREAGALARDLACGLAALHARGIVHRDLKPANVILHDGGGGPPVCKIIDLGISRASAAAADPVLFATLTATGQVLGTPEYMSYEQALGERDVDARTDVWALGVILFEMLDGRRPFQGDHPNAVLAAIRRGDPPLLRGAPRALAVVVARCLARAKDDRPRDGEALRAALDDAIAQGARDERIARLRVPVAVVCGLALLAACAALVSQRTPVSPAMETGVTTTVIAAPPPSSPPAPAAPDQASATPPTSSVPTAPSARPPRSITRVNSAGF